jgi:hypothetical protein
MTDEASSKSSDIFGTSLLRFCRLIRLARTAVNGSKTLRQFWCLLAHESAMASRQDSEGISPEIYERPPPDGEGMDSWQQGIRLSGAQKEILGLTTKRKVCGGKKILFCLGYFKDRNGAI